MKRSLIFLCVKCLTILVILSGCSTLQFTEQETCSTEPFVRTPVDLYLSQRFPKDAPIRLGIVPFSAPANVAGDGDQMPGMGNEVAHRVKNNLLATGSFPIIQFLNRHGWPGKESEFRSGNFDSMTMARNAGFDLVLVGQIEDVRSLESLSAQTKLIEVESGITVWSGRSEVRTNRLERQQVPLSAWFLERTPERLPTAILLNELGHCIVEGLLSEDPVPY